MFAALAGNLYIFFVSRMFAAIWFALLKSPRLDGMAFHGKKLLSSLFTLLAVSLAS